MPLDYYNKDDKVSDRYDPLDQQTGKDSDVTEETGSAGDDPAPGDALPGGAVSSGAEEIEDTDVKSNQGE